jgi:hypothetical protein
MQHPGIAQVFDAGMTGAGRPYCVMEYVDGVRITRFLTAGESAVAAPHGNPLRSVEEAIPIWDWSSEGGRSGPRGWSERHVPLSGRRK